MYDEVKDKEIKADGYPRKKKLKAPVILTAIKRDATFNCQQNTNI
jgi:hypothetical protein